MKHGKIRTVQLRDAAAVGTAAATRPKEWCMTDHHWPQLVPGAATLGKLMAPEWRRPETMEIPAPGRKSR